MGLDVDKLLNALENENNESLLDLNKEKISNMKNDILQKLNIKNDKLKLFHKKLKLYRYVDNVEDINYGSFIRWISLKTPNDIKLTNGGIVCDMKTKDESIYIICKCCTFCIIYLYLANRSIKRVIIRPSYTYCIYISSSC